jgi:hypothetical protein
LSVEPGAREGYTFLLAAKLPGAKGGYTFLFAGGSLSNDARRDSKQGKVAVWIAFPSLAMPRGVRVSPCPLFAYAPCGAGALLGEPGGLRALRLTGLSRWVACWRTRADTCPRGRSRLLSSVTAHGP